MIKLNEIKKRFKEKPILKSISFEVKQGDFKTIIGKIGSGKSTIIHLICGLIKPDGGIIYFNDMPLRISDRTFLNKVGFLLSLDYLIEDFSTILYWRSIGRLLNMQKGYLNSRIEYLLEICNISDPFLQISKLSSGNKMLVKFGTMLLHSPEVLVIDEPFIHLDIKEIEKIENVLKTCNKNGMTILMTTHSSEPLYRVGRDLLLLEDGIIKDHLLVDNYKTYETFRNTLQEYFMD